MKKPAQHLIAEVPLRRSRVEMTIGIDLGDVWSHYCTLNEAGEVVYRGRFRTSPKGVEKWFTDVPPARVATPILQDCWFTRFQSPCRLQRTDLDSSSRIGIPNQYAVAVPSGENVMKIVPVIKSRDLERSVRFYTKVLDFERNWPDDEDREKANGVAHLIREGAELLLSRHAGDGVFGSVNRVFVDDVDERYATFRARGLDTTQRPESPIHTAPVDQTWGIREFAVTDPDGNGLCCCTPIR